MRFMVDSNVNGLMFQLGNIMRIDNGFVEESVCFNTAGGYIVVSYNDTSVILISSITLKLASPVTVTSLFIALYPTVSDNVSMQKR